MSLTAQVANLWPLLLLHCILLVPGLTHELNNELQPEFGSQLPNLTIKQGSDTSFTCIVNHLGRYEVAWIHSENMALIAISRQMVTKNQRFSVTHNGNNTWTLHIKNVQYNDKGPYMCHLNTVPQRIQCGKLDVVVSPDIIEAETSNDVMVLEGQSVTLQCKATGYPPPKVQWKRVDGQALPVTQDLLKPPSEKHVYEGERLVMPPLQRADSGPYLCVANNSVPPVASKRVMLYVHFQPSIKVPNLLIAALLGLTVTLECIVEAAPKPQMYWINKERQPILNLTGKFFQDTEVVNLYLLRMKLTISHLIKEDFTDYNCTAGNALGATSAIIKLRQLPSPFTSWPTSSTTTHIDIWKLTKYADRNGRSENNSDCSVNRDQENMKYQRHHKRKRKGHRFASYEEDSSADMDMRTTAPSSVGGRGVWGDLSNSRHSQRSPYDGSNSITFYRRGSIGHMNLKAHATSSSSRSLWSSVTFTSSSPTGYLHLIILSVMTRLRGEFHYFRVALTLMLSP